MSWSWFGDPLNNTLASMAGPAQRPHVGAFFRALLDRTATADQDFDAAKKLVWEPLPIGPVNVGFVWNSDAGKRGRGLCARPERDRRVDWHRR